MAALQDAILPEVVELASLSANDLEPLLSEEIESWQHRFAWDFRPSADLLRRFLQIRSLYGYALRVGRDIVGYAYHVCEMHKGLIGDFYVCSDYATASNQMLLLSAVVQGLMLVSGIRRIESQLMMLHASPHNLFPFARYLTRYDRYFMVIEQAAIHRLSPSPVGIRVRFVGWTDKHQEEIARIVSAAYRGHVDSEINDQYRTIPGARHFLLNIVKYPGCGRFSPAASMVAIDESTGRVCAVCLASIVSPTSGHITQLCVLPAIRGARLGYELLRRVLLQLNELGCETVSLTVTCSNKDAIRLYESIGFQTHSTFPALVWEGF